MKSKGKRSEEGDKDTPTDGSNYLNDDSSDSVSHESKGKNKKRDEESHKETSVSEGASMIEFDPKKVFNKDTFIHCKTKEQATSFVEWAKEHYKKLGKTLLWYNGDEIEAGDHYHDLYEERTVYSIQENDLYFNELDDYDVEKGTLISFEDALLRKASTPVAPIVEFDIEAFLCGDFGVRCKTEDEARKLFVILKDNGVLWNDGEKCNPLTTCYRAPEQLYNCTNRKLLYGRNNELKYKDFSSFTFTIGAKKEVDEVTFDLSLFNSGNAMRCENAEQETAFLKYLGKKGVRRGTGEICSPYSDGKHREGIYYALKLEGLNYVLVYGIIGVSALKRKILPYEHFVVKDKPAPTEVDEADPVEIVTSKEEHMIEFDLSKFTENLGIHCETAEQAETFFKWLNNINAVWRADRLCEPNRTNYSIYKDRTVYFIELREDRKEVCYDSIDFSYKRHKPYEYFLKRDTKVVEFDLSKFTENLGIHCPTKEQAETLFRFFERKGIRWARGDACNDANTNYSLYGGNTMYILKPEKGLTVYGWQGVKYGDDCKPYEYFLEEVTELKTPDDLKYNVKDPNMQFNLSKFTRDVGIHCRTGEQARTFFWWLDSLDAAWEQTGCACHSLSTGYDRYRENTVYFLIIEWTGTKPTLTVTYRSLSDAQSCLKECHPYEYFIKGPKTTNKTKKRKETMLEDTTAKVIKNAKKAAKLSKDTIITAQRGATVLAATKAGLNKGPLPEKMKELINTPVWGDFIAGIVLHTVVPTVTDSRKAEQAVEAANIVASVGLSGHYSWLQDMVKGIIESIPDIGAKAKEAVVETVEGLPS